MSDVSTLHQAGLLKAVSLNYVYGNVYVITAEGYAYVDAMRARLASPVEDQPTGWDAVDAALDRLKRLAVDAKDTQDFKGVGHQAVTVLEVLGRTAFDPERHLPTAEPLPAPNDVKRRIALIIDSTTGERFEHVRKLMRAAYTQAQAVKHRDEPDDVDAGIAADAVILLVAILRRLVGENSANAAALVD